MIERLFLPGFLLMGVLIGGGYATGREVVQFFLQNGITGGLVGLLLAMVLLSVVCAMSFEVARLSGNYNYRSFFRLLLGQWWFLYELAFLTLCMFVLGVLGSAAGEIASAQFEVPGAVGTVTLMLAIAALVVLRTDSLERILGSWSLALYFIYALFLVLFLTQFGTEFQENMQRESPLRSGAILGGVQYVGYNIAAVPVVLFCVVHMQSRRDAFLAGALAGPIALFPALFLFLSMVSVYPEVIAAQVPADFMLGKLDAPYLREVFYVAVFGTFIQTGTGCLHAVNERVAEAVEERGGSLARWQRSAIALAGLLIAIVLAEYIGLVALVAKGYGTLAWIFIGLYLLPLMAVGMFRARRVAAADRQ